MLPRARWLGGLVAALLAVTMASAAAQEAAQEAVGVVAPAGGRPYAEVWLDRAGAPGDSTSGLVWRGTRLRVLETREGRARVAIVGWVDAGALVVEGTGERVAEPSKAPGGPAAEAGSASGPVLKLDKKLAGKALDPDLVVLAFDLERLGTDRYFYEMRGAARNTSARRMVGFTVELLLYDRDKQLLQREVVAGQPPEVPPGLVTEFETIFEPPVGLAHYQANFAWTWGP